LEFRALIDPHLPRRPLVGINGEIYLRSNRFSNSNLVRACEDAGLEVVVSPMGEWIKYISYRNLEDAIKDKKFKKILNSYIRKRIQERDERSVTANCGDSFDAREPSTSEILKLTSRYLSPKCGSEAVLSIGGGVHWLKSPKFAGVISVMPHGCMPGGIVAAMAEKLSTAYQKPWISLTYDGFSETNNLVRVSNFAEVIRFCSKEADKPLG
jgi:predicted nucleotide-binding protein (sugar kinase/HSP70/actin superfamily)